MAHLPDVVDLKDKILRALNPVLNPEYIRLENEDGISGFVVSRQFENMSALDRQRLIEKTLRQAPGSLTPEEHRQVLLIAGLTPAEYDAVGTRVRIHKVREMAGGAVEVLLQGSPSDAEYVRQALQKDPDLQVRATEPKSVPGAPGVLVSFRVRGPKTTPLTKERVLQTLKKNPYIEIMANA